MPERLQLDAILTHDLPDECVDGKSPSLLSSFSLLDYTGTSTGTTPTKGVDDYTWEEIVVSMHGTNSKGDAMMAFSCTCYFFKCACDAPIPRIIWKRIPKNFVIPRSVLHW
eukprot:15335260-Ditylum_brightwellii.AAC.1